MARDIYKHGKRQKPAWKKQNHLAVVLFVFLALVSAGIVAVAYDLISKNRNQPASVSKTTIRPQGTGEKVFSTPYFSFKDSGNWQLATTESTKNKFIFRKYLGHSQVVQHQLLVFINTSPSSLELTSPIALRVAVDGAKLKPLGITPPCGEAYPTNQPLLVRPSKIEGVTILCDPDSPQYKVVFARQAGDYNLKFQRKDGTQANYIIIYQNQKVQPDSIELLRIAESFQAL